MLFRRVTEGAPVYLDVVEEVVDCDFRTLPAATGFGSGFPGHLFLSFPFSFFFGFLFSLSCLDSPVSSNPLELSRLRAAFQASVAAPKKSYMRVTKASEFIGPTR
jgi:hypothetical protein